MRIGEQVATSFCAPSINPRAKLPPIRKAQFLGFWSSNPAKMEEKP
jgi:hypothetical protein